MKNSISIVWHIEDVKSADGEETDLTDTECCEVLARAEYGHDANYGINWEVLQCYIDQVKNERNV